MGFTDSELEFERGFLAGSFYRYIGESFAERPTSFVTAAGERSSPSRVFCLAVVVVRGWEGREGKEAELKNRMSN